MIALDSALPPVRRAMIMPAPADRLYERRSRLFAHAGFIICMVFQRFGFMSHSGALFFSLPAFALLLGWALLAGIATIRARGAALYMMFTGWTLIATLVALVSPDARFGISVTSLGALLVTYGFTVIGPGLRFDRTVLFPIFLFYTRLCAVLGIIQWGIQFAGVKIFSFMLTVPAMRPILIESQYNYNPTLHYGSSILRSNGFFLIEPSVFSQTLAIAIVIDYFILGRVKYLPLYLLAYLVSFSGTGALTLTLAIPFYACLSARNFGRVAGLGIAGVIGLTLGAIAFPDQVGSLLSRVNELNYSGSSGYARFIGPFLPIADLLHEMRILIGYGPGATERYIYHVEGTGNSIAKLIIDYGLIGLAAFLGMFTGTLWRREMAILPVVALMTFVVGGGYLLFTPILMMLMMLCIWSGLPDGFRSAER